MGDLTERQSISKVNGEVMIRPYVTEQQIREIAKTFYGVTINPEMKIFENESYDDRSYIIHGKLISRGDSDLDEIYSKHNKFVLKLFTSWQTNNIDSLEDIFHNVTNYNGSSGDTNKTTATRIHLPQCIRLLSEEHTPKYLGKCQLPIQCNSIYKGCTKEELVTQGLISESKNGFVYAVHITRLTIFVPGKIVDYENLSDELLWNWGEAAGKVTLIMKELSISPCVSNTVWDIIRCPDKIKDPFINAVHDAHKRKVLEKIVSDFQMDILPKMQRELTLEWIHSDLNEHNMLHNRQHEIVAILDFDDCFYSYRVVDIATAMMYLSTGSDINNILSEVKKLFKGYCSVIQLNETELNSLYQLMLMRYVISVSVGAYQHTLEPHNEYLLFTQTKAWERLDVLVNIGKDNFLREITS